MLPNSQPINLSSVGPEVYTKRHKEMLMQRGYSSDQELVLSHSNSESGLITLILEDETPTLTQVESFDDYVKLIDAWQSYLHMPNRERFLNYGIAVAGSLAVGITINPLAGIVAGSVLGVRNHIIRRIQARENLKNNLADLPTIIGTKKVMMFAPALIKTGLPIKFLDGI